MAYAAEVGNLKLRGMAKWDLQWLAPSPIDDANCTVLYSVRSSILHGGFLCA